MHAESISTNNVMTFRFARVLIKVSISTNGETRLKICNHYRFLSPLISLNFVRKTLYGNKVAIMLHYARLSYRFYVSDRSMFLQWASPGDDQSL